MEKSERQLEAIFIATPPSSPLSMALTRTTTPRNLPTMYHFDFGPATMESDTIEPQEENDAQDAMPQATLSTSPPIPEHGDASNLTPCPNCSRTFNLNALRKHVPICDKVTKKRNIFDSSRQRREGTELATYVLPKNFGLPNADKIAGVHTPAPVISRAPEATEQLVQSPLMARRKSQGNTELVRSTARASLRKAATPVEPATPSNAIMPAVDLTRSRKRSSDRSIAKRIKDVACDRCPHCDRTFNPKAFDRHVEWCKEKAIQATIKLANTNETSKAKERLDARKQYKPPNLKTKRSINRDKYSGSNEQTQQDFSEMVNNKPSLLSQSSLTSSGHSENQQRRNMMSNINRPGNFAAPYNSKTSVTQNTVSLHMTTDEPPKNARISSTRTSPKSKKHVVCDTIDDTMQRLRRRTNGENLKLVTPECVETALAQVDKKQPTKTNAKIAIIKELNLPPMKEQRFEKLNKLVNRKGETTVCRVQMDDADSFRLPVRTKERTSTSLTRQARRKVLTREHPSLEIRNNQKQEQNTHKLMPFNKLHYDAKNSNNSEFIQSPSSDFIHEPIEYAATKHHKMQRMLYGNSHDNISSNREIQIKLETNTTTSICRPKKRSNEFTHLGRIKPMRAMPMPQLSQCFGELVQTMGEDGNQEIGDHNDIDFDIDALHCKDYNLDTYDDGRVEDLACCDIELSKFDFSRVDDENEEELKPLRKHGSSNSSISRRLVVLEEDEDGVMYIKPASPQSNSGRGFSKSGLSSSVKYDPFLSAKRQLEELCSTSMRLDDASVDTAASPIPHNMSTSLIVPDTLNRTQMQSSSTTKQPLSNFRRTSSLRGPRRPPLLPSRPLFAANYRPTIQRGLSDEGPISTNFLKPEEFDEIPVRAACGNDFHSPRVVRRDTSISNRKQQQKLHSELDDSQQRNVAKTDSLAVFLKYEHELDQLNAKAVEAAKNSLSSKDLKDKSNTLSKQNSAKNLRLDLPTPITLATSMTPQLTVQTSKPKENIENLAHNLSTSLRLEPISSKPHTPLLSKSSTPQQHQLPTISKIQQSKQLEAVKLGSISGHGRLERKLSSGSDYIDPKLINPCDNLYVQSCGSDESSTHSSNESTKAAESQLMKLQSAAPLSQSSSQSTITQVRIEKRNSTEGRNLLKRKIRLGRNQFLYDISPDEGDCSSCCSADDEANRSSMEYDEQFWKLTSLRPEKQLIANTISHMPIISNIPTFDDFDFEEFLSSFEHDDDEQFPLFKDCREFLLNRTTSRNRLLKTNSTPKNQEQTSTIPTQIPTTTYTPTPSEFFNKSTNKPSSYTHAALRSISNLSNSGDSFKATCNSGNEKEKYYREKSLACNSSNDNKQTTESKCSDRHKGEIFISIETEPNALGDSPISPDSLRHMVGNEQTPIEMVEIKDGNEPEHSKFSKISDTDDVDAEVSDHVGDGPSKLALSATAAPTSRQDSKLEIDTLPNVQINNAKNLIQQMQSEFRQLGQDAGASMRKAMQLRTARSEVDFEKANEDDEAKKSPIQSTAQRGIGLSRTTPIGDSDELSSLDGYPISSSQSSRHGASSKLSSDSAYGSNSPSNLSRQRSIELSNTPRFQGISAPSSGLHCPRPHTTSGAVERKCTSVSPRTIPDVASQDYSDYATPKSRQQLFGVGSAVVGNNGNDTHESLSSGSENSLTMAAPQSNFNFQQQQSLSASQAASYNKSCTLDNKNNNISSVAVTPTTSQYSLLSNTSNSSMCSSMKMSKFCHECGAKFIIEHAKFCMECGVKRVIL